jgi:hypothetical protein
MKKVNVSVLLAAACLSGWATVAGAGPVVTVTNTTLVESYKGTTAVNTFFAGNNYWSGAGGNIGAPIYNTPSATISWSNSNTVDIKFNTGMYSGVDNTFNPTVYGADVFLKSGGGNTLPGLPTSSFFNDVISLGFNAPDGGNATAGLYTIPAGAKDGTTYKTSQDIWSGRAGDTYGGAYAASGACAPNVAACANSTPSPTVLLAGQGTAVAGVTVKTTSTPPGGGGSVGTLDVQLTGTGNVNTVGTGLYALNQLFQNFDIFWGTGDCSNAPIWGNVAGLTRVPEPSSLALLATAAIGFRIMRRRKRKAPAVG